MEYKKLLLNDKYINFNTKLNLNPLLSEKPKSLKDKHFMQFYDHLFKKLSEQKKIETFSLTEDSSNRLNHQNISYSYDNPIINKRNFKNPKNINYKLLKFNPYKTYFKINKLNSPLNFSKKKQNKNIDISQKNININTISFYNIRFNKAKEKLKRDNNKRDKQVNVNVNNSNIMNKSNKKEYIDLINKINVYNNNEKKKRIKIKKYYENNVREGYFGKKDTFGIPYFYDTSTIFNNEYANKSEKNRHEILLNELNKLKTYLNRHPDKRLFIIKDFLNKFHMDKIENYSSNQLLYLSNFILNANNSEFAKYLKPYLNIKNMLYDILNNSLELNNLYLEENDSKRITNNNESQQTIPNDINNSKFKNSEIKYSDIFQSNSDNLNQDGEPLKKNIEFKKTFYLSPLIKQKNKKHLSQSVKIGRIFLNKSSLLFEKNDNNVLNKSHEEKKDKSLDLNSTNSNLKYFAYQTKSFIPNKNYLNNNTVINEIGKEIKEIENDYNEKLKELELMKNSENKKGLCFLRRKSVDYEIKDKLYINIRNRNNTRLKTLVPIHYNFTKNFTGEMKNLNDIIQNKLKIVKTENNIYLKKLISIDNCYLNSTDAKNSNQNNSPKKEKNGRKMSQNFEKNKNSKNGIEIIKRLYYIPTRKKFGLQEIKNRLKLTEYIALTHAKNNIYKKEMQKIVNE